MSQKPFSQRLEEIDDKLDELVHINRDVTQSILNFTFDLNDTRQEINHEVVKAFLRLQGTSSD